MAVAKVTLEALLDHEGGHDPLEQHPAGDGAEEEVREAERGCDPAEQVGQRKAVEDNFAREDDAVRQ